MIRPLLRIDLLHDMRSSEDPSTPAVEMVYQILDEFYAAASAAGLFFQSAWVAKVLKSAEQAVRHDRGAPRFMWSAEGIYLSTLFEDLVDSWHVFEGRTARQGGEMNLTREDWLRAVAKVRRNIERD